MGAGHPQSSSLCCWIERLQVSLYLHIQEPRPPAFPVIEAAEIRKFQSVDRVTEMADFAVDEAACPKKTGFSSIVPRRAHTRTDYTQVVLERK